MTALWALPVGAIVTLIVTPAAAAVARRAAFYDHPVGYKRHEHPTPYLGGAAVFVGFIAAVLSSPLHLAPFAPLLLCATALLVLGTIDDRIPVRPVWRILAEVGTAVILSATGHGWEVFGSPLADLALTTAWVVGLVNAFNLMDNLDGAAATVAGVCAAAAAALAVANGGPSLATLALALAGACAGFLWHNLARPARIFLGDGGSMLLGLLVAGLTMGATRNDGVGASALLVGAMVVGLPVLDTTLVVVSRLRAGIPVVQAGRDHLTHRILARLASPREVAIALAAIQALLGALALAGESLGTPYVIVLAGLCVVGGMATIAVLESPAWKPVRSSLEPPPSAGSPVLQPSPPGAWLVPTGGSEDATSQPYRGAEDGARL
jgi:UDP-GlcNAc:undecaprenyl-phosphate/decaprenyl-phosphate GlcNAc-1-phosphate transferase